MKGMRKTLLGFAYLLVVGGVSALEILKHTPADLTGMGLLAGGLAAGLGTVMWGNAQEHKAAASIGKTPNI
jgi:hypothetical protein